MTRIDRYAFGSATALVVTGIILGYILGYGSCRQTTGKLPTTIVRRDTTVIHDTTFIDRFSEVTRTAVDTMWVRVAPNINVASKLPASKISLTDSPSPNERSSSANKISTPEYAYLDENVPIKQKTADSDSLFVGLPYEQVTVRDSIFTAQISGYKPHLDWIRITRPTRIVTIEKAAKTPPKKWSVGATAGPALVYNKDGIHGGIGVAVGVQYRF